MYSLEVWWVGSMLKRLGSSVQILQGLAPIRFSVLDFTGVLEVRDPAAFLAAIARGFGRAKAFGCGLMLIRRA